MDGLQWAAGRGSSMTSERLWFWGGRVWWCSRPLPPSLSALCVAFGAEKRVPFHLRSANTGMQHTDTHKHTVKAISNLTEISLLTFSKCVRLQLHHIFRFFFFIASSLVGLCAITLQILDMKMCGSSFLRVFIPVLALLALVVSAEGSVG